MLTASKISKSHGGRLLFDDVSFQINAGDRVGLIGANGAGKSTLFSLLLGDASPDTGTISLRRNATLGFLPQESAPSGDETILELALSIDDTMSATLADLRQPDSERHDAAHAEFVERDGYALEARGKRILSGLAFRETDFDRPARSMSGGWIMRAHLARLLLMEPELLLLDEPTNHLDLETLGWFQNQLLAYPGAILTISHDREFLNALCGEIIEISRCRLHRYRGNYDEFLVQKAAREEQHAAAYRNQQKEIEHLEDFVRRFRAKASKAAQAQERIKRLEKMERVAPPESAEAVVKIRFPQPPRGGQRVITIENAVQAYGEHVMYQGLNLEIERGQRIVLVGPNGAGKSTLLKILAGLVPLNSGAVLAGHNLSLGYFAQHRTEVLDSSRTVLSEAMEGLPVGEQFTRTVLGSFLFRGDDVFKTVGVLSGGEKSRLALAKLLLNPPNLLLLDEPTTHLDMPSIDALIHALSQYEGTIVFVSHDVFFIRALARQVLHIHAGRLTPYAGGYDYYLEKSGASSERAALVAELSDHRPQKAPTDEPPRPTGSRETRELRREEARLRKEAAQARREKESLLAAAESEVLALEERQSELTRELEDPATYDKPARALELNRELAGISESLERANSAWSALAGELAGAPGSDQA